MESMTGFGSFSSQKEIRWTWTLRSVNAKGLEIKCRYPQGCETLEQKIRECLRSFFIRGNILVSLEIMSDPQQQYIQINHPFLEQICRLAEQLQELHPSLRPACIDGLLNVRGVVDVHSATTENYAEFSDIFLTTLEKAAESLKLSRLTEGQKISSYLNEQINQMEQLLYQAKNLAGLQPQRIRQKLTENLSLLTHSTDLSEERFMQEVTAYMLRADIREELDRLSTHIHTARTMLSDKGAIGRKLDFLCQELNREANTLCSKSADIELTNVGMMLKTLIDQFREQVQNIE